MTPAEILRADNAATLAAFLEPTNLAKDLHRTSYGMVLSSACGDYAMTFVTVGGLNHVLISAKLAEHIAEQLRAISLAEQEEENAPDHGSC